MGARKGIDHGRDINERGGVNGGEKERQESQMEKRN